MNLTEPLLRASSVERSETRVAVTADVEGTHGELRAGFADGLRGDDDADGFNRVRPCGPKRDLRP